MRRRECVEPQYGGLPCEGSLEDWQDCNTHPCPSKYDCENTFQRANVKMFLINQW